MSAASTRPPRQVDAAVDDADAPVGGAGEVRVVRHGDDRLVRARARARAGSRRTLRLDAVSRLPVGSSARMISGSLASARAIATRWRWPPESWSGRLCACSARPRSREQLARRARGAPSASSSAEPRASAACTLSSAENSASRKWNWNTKPSLREPQRRRAVLVEARGVLAVEPDPPRGRHVEQAQQVQQRGLARARRAHDRRRTRRARSRRLTSSTSVTGTSPAERRATHVLGRAPAASEPVHAHAPRAGCPPGARARPCAPAGRRPRPRDSIANAAASANWLGAPVRSAGCIGSRRAQRLDRDLVEHAASARSPAPMPSRLPHTPTMSALDARRCGGCRARGSPSTSGSRCRASSPSRSSRSCCRCRTRRPPGSPPTTLYMMMLRIVQHAQQVLGRLLPRHRLVADGVARSAPRRRARA